LNYTISHRTTYRYHERVHESYVILYLQPRTDGDQLCTRYHVVIEPAAKLFAYVDRDGNDVQHFSLIPEHDRLSVETRSEVVTLRGTRAPVPEPSARELLENDAGLGALFDQRRESRYVRFVPQLLALAGEAGAPGRDLAEWFLTLGSFVNRAFTYEKGATTVHSTVAEVVAARAGVCQDLAHVMIGLLRLQGIPARYVSGYVFSGQQDRVLGAEASHAWCEAYLPPNGWVGFDPTNDTLIDERFVKIAVGRDYGDVSPIRGIYKGAAQSTMSVDVAVAALGADQQ
jgi:transglutaminase-like putative cysteine protease